jgi:hypothetical protein
VANQPVVQVIGLRALFRDLTKMSDPAAGVLAKAMSAAGKDAFTPVATELAAAYPHRSGRLAASVRVTSSRTGAAIRVGKKAVPYAGPVDFGGYPAGREYLKDGRYLYPTVRRHTAAAVVEYERAVTAAVNTYAWTNESNNPKED